MELTRPGLTALLFASMALAGCVGATSALHGVGAPSRQIAVADIAPPENSVADENADRNVDQSVDQFADASGEAPVIVSDGAPRRSGIVSLSYQAQGGGRTVTAPVEEPRVYVDSEVPPTPQIAPTREEGIEQMRAKAATSATAKPNVFATRSSSIPHLTYRERLGLEAELRSDARSNVGKISAGESSALQADAVRLRKNAASHYSDAVRKIEE